MHIYEVRPRKDHSGVDLISDALPFGRLWYAEPGAISNAIDYAKGPSSIETLARVAAQMEEPDRAITALQNLLSIPYESPLAANVPMTPALLRLDPMFDPLRNDPRFEKLIASPAPKTAGK